MNEDLKIEIRKLLALHEATVRLEHGVREVQPPGSAWRVFIPSRFIYAFFTFNSIYAFDWQSSFDRRKAIRWQPDKENGKYPGQDDQLKAYLKYINNQLSPDTQTFFGDELKRMIDLFSINEPVDALRHVKLVNANKKIKNLSKQLSKHLYSVLESNQKSDDFYKSAYHLLKFVYKVRCNLFHGKKTRVQLLNSKQQERFKIYTALLIAANSLLFKLAEKANIGWKKVSVELN
ncbi:MAG: hypothetical protein ACFFCW_49530 [Candidatus Hodarchaeota archaeon]